MLGFRNKFKDPRVDKILLYRKGYSVHHIFYSPIKIWLFFSFLLMGMALPLTLVFIHELDEKIAFYILIYGSISYVVAAFLNNSFVLNGDSFLVVNPNLPFKRIKEFPIKEIHQIELGHNKWLYAARIFGPLGINYVEIRSRNRIERYYCAGLELDCFDENQTQLTLDDLYFTLKRKGIPTVSPFEFHE